ncbi:MAG: tyrosine-type recombinase/integrase [Candidatus Omnitrophica bacterium]|nr:tyrosine-type recombinase/integrase [Candidatus Omnitrophota bacterium]
MESLIIRTYLDELKLNGRSDNTIKTYHSLLIRADRFKPLTKWKKDDVNKYFIHLQENSKPATFEASKLRVKKFFEWKGSKICNHITAKIESGGEIEAKDILTVEEVQLMIDTTKSPMYQALIAFLFESGARISEVLPIKVSDVEETDKGMINRVYETKAKTSKRPILCLFSGQYIRNLISYLNLKDDSRLFPIEKSSAYRMLVNIGKRAGIEKKSNPHRMRHAQARQLLEEEYDPLIINKKLGLAPNSNVRARYTHVGDDDVINATLRHSGGEIVKRTPQRLAEPETIHKLDDKRTLIKLNDENEQFKTSMQDLQAQLNKLKINFQTAAFQRPTVK